MLTLTNIVLASLVAAMLAGCANTTGPVDGEQFDGFDEPLQATSTTGVIRGIIVDSSIVPVAGVDISLANTDHAAITDDEGRFAFVNLEPATYFIVATKVGFGTIQQSALVVAGVDKPSISRILMYRIPGSEPFTIPLHVEGIMMCSTQVAVAFATGCMVGDYTGDHSRNWYPVDEAPTFWQSELTWETTQTLAQDACMRNYASERMGGPMIADDSCGPSPRIQSANEARLAEVNVGAGQGVENVVWVSPLEASGNPILGLAVDQKFDVYIHLFQNWSPPEGWSFLADGDTYPPA